MTCLLGAQAQDDLIEIAVYLNTKSPGLGDRFLDDVDAQLAFILEYPEASAVLCRVRASLCCEQLDDADSRLIFAGQSTR